MAFTKVTGPGIHTLSNIISHNIDSSGIITATKFVGTVEGPITGDLVTNDWVTHEGNTTTRIGFPDTNKVEIQANSKTVLHVDTAGIVGINTDSPSSAHLDIATTTGTYDNLRLRRTSSGVGDSNWSLKPYAGHLYFRQGGSTDKIVFESGGKIGLNTMTVGDTLHIHQLNANHGIKLERGGATNPGSTTIQVHSHGALSVTSSNNITHTSGGSQQHVWMQGTNEAMRIDENRRLGIGTDNPATKVHIHGGDETLLITGDTAVGSAANTGGTLALGGIYHTDGSITGWSQIKGFKDNNTSNNYNGYLSFTTRDTTAGYREHLRITSAGDVNIGNAGGTAAHHASGLFNGVTPKFEVKLGAAANSYTRYINIMNPGAQTGSETLGRVGIKLSLGSEASSGESNKSGAIYAESTSGYNNGTALCLATNNTEKLRITSTGQLQATGAADVRLTLGSSGTAGTNDSVHIRADSADLKFMAASGGTTIFETNGTETFRIESDGKIDLKVAGYEADIYHTGSGDRWPLRLLNSDTTSGNMTGIYFGPCNNVAGAYISGKAEADFTSTANRDAGLEFGTRLDGNWKIPMAISAAGYVTKPLHPSFLARRSTGGDGRGAASPITEWSNSTTAPCHNIGGHFSHTTGKFTAPVAGVYHFSANPGYKQSGNNYNVKFRIDSTDEFEPVRFIDGGDDLTSHSTGTGSITVYMTKDQTMSVCIAYTHHVNTSYNYFSGHLIG